MTDIIHERTNIARNNLITLLDQIDKEYRIIIEFALDEVKDGFPNIVHFTTGGNSMSYGDRIPAMYYDGDNSQLIIVSAINNTANFIVKAQDIFPEVEYRVEILQENIANEYIYSVVVNQKQISRVVNHRPQIFRNIHVFASDPWFGSQSGYIKRLHLECLEFAKPKRLMDKTCRTVAEPAPSSSSITSGTNSSLSASTSNLAPHPPMNETQYKQLEEKIEAFWDQFYTDSTLNTCYCTTFSAAYAHFCEHHIPIKELLFHNISQEIGIPFEKMGYHMARKNHQPCRKEGEDSKTEVEKDTLVNSKKQVLESKRNKGTSDTVKVPRKVNIGKLPEKLPGGIAIKLDSKIAVQQLKKVELASVFNNDSSSEEEEMPLKCRMKMKNIGKDTPTSVIAHSFKYW